MPFVVLVCTQYLQLHIAYKVQISKCNVQHEAGSIAKKNHNNMYKQKKTQQKQRNTQGKYTDGPLRNTQGKYTDGSLSGTQWTICVFSLCVSLFLLFCFFLFFFCMLFCLFSAGAVNPSALAATMNKLVTLTMPLRTGSHSIQKSLSPL